LVGVDIERDDVLGRDLVERDALTLDEDRPLVRQPRAHVAERQVDVAFERKDPAGPRDLLPQRLRDLEHRRSV
jgi:hypothetical protein